VKLLFPEIPEGAVPWGLPVVAEDVGAAGNLQSVLLEEGIGAWGWPDLPAEVTEAAFPYECNLAGTTVVLPVHQGVDAGQVQHIADTVIAWSLTR
jgi:hypothetical protein